jgi:hypothetical protein
VSGYIAAGYVVVLGTLVVYAATLLRRERLARLRLGPPRPPAADVDPEVEAERERPAS